MSYEVCWYNRDFSLPPHQPKVHVDLANYGHSAIGGPDRAEGPAIGSEDDLLELASFLRRPVEVFDERANCWWWGYLHEVELSGQGAEIVLSLDDMANNVRVLCTTGTGKADAGWIFDTTSIALYGTKELVVPAADTSQGGADARAARILAARKLPGNRPPRHTGREDEPLSATCRFHGWWDTLGWKYYRPVAGAAYWLRGCTKMQFMGNVAANTKVAQAFITSSTVSVKALDVMVFFPRVGVSADSLRLELCANNAGVPGAVLETKDIANADLKTQVLPVHFVLAETTALSPATTYWLVFSRTGALDTEFFYQVQVSEEAFYGGGACYLYNGATWVPRSPPMSVLRFQVLEGWDVVDAIADICGSTTCGQFLAGADKVLASAGVQSPVYRIGDRTGAALLADLIETGTSNSRRVIPHVTRERLLRIEEEIAAPTDQSELRVTRGGLITGRFGHPIEQPLHAVRSWARLDVAEALERYPSFVANAGLNYIERAELDCHTGLVRADDMVLQSFGQEREG